MSPNLSLFHTCMHMHTDTKGRRNINSIYCYVFSLCSPPVERLLLGERKPDLQAVRIQRSSCGTIKVPFAFTLSFFCGPHSCVNTIKHMVQGMHNRLSKRNESSSSSSDGEEYRVCLWICVCVLAHSSFISHHLFSST